MSLATLVVVKVFDHRGVANHVQHQHAEVTCCIRSEQLVLLEHMPTVFDSARAGRKVAVPEERHLLFEWSRGFNHACNPPLLQLNELTTVVGLRLIFFAFQALHCRFIASAASRIQLLALLACEWWHHIAIEVIGRNGFLGL